MTGPYPDLELLRGWIAEALREFLAVRRSELAAIGAELDPVAEAVESFVRGGKRLRPAFAYWGWRGAGGQAGDGERAVVRAAAALELVHACALVHDDVMDASASRRGAPSVHERFGAMHRGHGWSGRPEAFGRAAAILIGDLALIWADAMLAESGLDPATVAAVRPAYDAMRTEVMAGQYLDVLAQARAEHEPPGDAVAEALRVARYKSAGYTVERPLHLGGLIAGAGPELLRTYSAYGIAVGEAFQLRDDVLGVFGDPGRTGKPAGDDLREGKRTVLIALALQTADEAQRRLLTEALGQPGLGPAEVSRARTVLVDTGALDAVEKMISDRTSAALALLESAEMPPDAREVLSRLAVLSTERAS